jgi:hypothetical protein
MYTDRYRGYFAGYLDEFGLDKDRHVINGYLMAGLTYFYRVPSKPERCIQNYGFDIIVRDRLPVTRSRKLLPSSCWV